MNYPVWDVPFLGAGLVVAIIAIVHILISHIAVGGGAFLFVAEMWADRQPDGARVRAWLHRYATFFLVFTTVAGAMTGVGIWFSIQLAGPEATSLLIHQFVFAWATEWVAFIGELTVLYLYYYGWSVSSRRMQVFLAGAYFVIAWISLVIINGILTFMLTPGGWTLANKDIAAGFFNPGYTPALLLRTVVMFLLAGLSALVVASRIDEEDLKERVVRFAVKWVVPAALLAPIFMIWYWSKLPSQPVKLAYEGVAGLAGGKLEILSRAVWLAAMAGSLLVAGALVIGLRPRAVTTTAAAAMLGMALLGIAGAEFFREMARKPFVVRDVLYSNSLWVADADATTRAKPFLSRAHWHPEVAPLSAQHGEWVFRLQCASCHTLHGYRALDTRTAAWSGVFGFKWLATMDSQGVMPPFQGNEQDRAALAAYLVSMQGATISGSCVLDDARAAAAAPAGSANPGTARAASGAVGSAAPAGVALAGEVKP
jgi:cytochrome bd ubiquinol oxidase subunit I